MSIGKNLPGFLILLAFMTIACGEKGNLFPPELTSFTPYEGNPLFAGGPDTAWDRKIRERGFILRDGDTWHMYYTGYDGTPENIPVVDRRKLGHARSADGIHWERTSEQPMYDSQWVEDVCVLKHEGTFYLFAEGEPHTHWMRSGDGLNWKSMGPLNMFKASGEEEDNNVGTPTVYIADGGIWYLFYQNTGGVWLATATDPSGSWTNVKDEPVLSAGPEIYDRGKAATDQVFKYKGRYYMYYHGRSEKPGPSPQFGTHLAASDDLIHWTKYPGNPVIGNDMSSGIVVYDGEKLRMYTMHDQVRLFWSDAVVKSFGE